MFGCRKRIERFTSAEALFPANPKNNLYVHVSSILFLLFDSNPKN